MTATINRIRWDKSLNPPDFSLTYVDRFTPVEQEIAVKDLNLDGDFMRVGESVIPLHRVRRILFKGKVVWDKRGRP